MTVFPARSVVCRGGGKTAGAANGAGLFPRAVRYAPPAPAGPPRLRETPRRLRAADFTERHLQGLWYDARWRPAVLRDQDGEPVVVEDPGIWNLEAGPDFLGAALRLGPDERRVTGDVEVHIHPADWARHGHDRDRRYDRVRVHVTWYPGPPPGRGLPPGLVQIALRDIMATCPRFSFDNLDLPSYPAAARATEPPCRRILAGCSAERRGLLLDAAGEERVRRKAQRLAAAIEEEGAAQVFYREVMTALGYKSNKMPFRRLADTVPQAALLEESRANPQRAYALLAGVAGLLPETLDPRWDAETRKVMRALWDHWWKLRLRWDKHRLPRGDWTLAGMRPVNHPLRRLMAAATWFARPPPPGERWASAARAGGPAEELALAQLATDDQGYWNFRLGLAGRRLSSPVGLLGPDRRGAMLWNVIRPFLVAAGGHAPPWSDPEGGATGEENRTVRQTALNLFGPDPSPALYRTGLRRQGLIQIFQDYCLNDRSRCATCGLPGLLRANFLKDPPVPGKGENPWPQP